MIKRVLSLAVVVALMVNIFAVSTMAKEEAEVVTATEAERDYDSLYSSVKEKAEKSDKVLDVKAYNKAMKKAKTPEEQMAVSAQFREFAAYETVEYFSSAADESTMGLEPMMGVMSSASQGDTRIISSYYLIASTQYDSKYGSSLDSVQQLAVDIGVGFTHPMIWVFFSVINTVVNENSPDWAQYTDVIHRTLLDGIVEEKTVEVYKVDWFTGQGQWEPMVYSSKLSESSQINTVYYKNRERLTPSNYDLGLIRTVSGDYYGSDWYLIDLAESTTSPLSFPYQNNGTEVTYDKTYRFMQPE